MLLVPRHWVDLVALTILNRFIYLKTYVVVTNQIAAMDILVPRYSFFMDN